MEEIGHNVGNDYGRSVSRSVAYHIGILYSRESEKCAKFYDKPEQ